MDVPRGQSITVTLKKEGTGLGFSLEGGKDSPYGDRPMTVKKIFTGASYFLQLFVFSIRTLFSPISLLLTE